MVEKGRFLDLAVLLMECVVGEWKKMSRKRIGLFGLVQSEECVEGKQE